MGRHIRARRDDPEENILWARPDEPLLGLLERLLANDVNQMPVVSNSDDGNGCRLSAWSRAIHSPRDSNAHRNARRNAKQ